MHDNTSERSWYERFFDQWYLDTYTESVTAEGSEREARFLADTLGVAAPARVLDLACGQGRHLVRLAGRGYRMVGLDLSPVLLERAREAAAARAASIALVRGDMRALPFPDASFDAAYNYFTAFGYFSREEDDRQVLREVARVLRPGGHFVLEFINAYYLARVFQPRTWQEFGDVRVLEERRWDALAGRIFERRVYQRPGEAIERTLELRLYVASELAELFRQAGLAVRDVLDPTSRTPFQPASRRLAIVGIRE